MSPARKRAATASPADVDSPETATPATQLDTFLDKYEPAIAAEAREALALLTARLPQATRLVYDNYNALVIGFGPSERTSEAILSLAVYPRWLTLFFLQGTRIADGRGLLQGTGSTVRSVRLPAAAFLADARVEALIADALACAVVPMPGAGTGMLVIKSVSAKQRPRR
jgi:hypothetical protein